MFVVVMMMMMIADVVSKVVFAAVSPESDLLPADGPRVYIHADGLSSS